MSPVLLILTHRVGDILAFAVAGLLACLAASTLDPRVRFAELGPQILVVLCATATASLLLGRLGVYSPARLRHWRSHVVRRLVGTVASVPVSVLCIVLIPSDAGLLPAWPIAWTALSMLFLTGGHRLSTAAARYLDSAGHLSRRVAVVGLNPLSESFLARASRDPSRDFVVIGCFRDGEDEPAAEHAGHSVLGDVADIVEHGRRERIDAVVLAIPLSQQERIARARAVLAEMAVDIYLTTDLAGLQFESHEVQDIASTPVVRVRSRPLSPWQAFQKGLVDRVFAVLMLVALSPVLIGCALMVRLTSPGPVLFRQPRVGYNGVSFLIYKFRTMHHASADLLADRQTTRGDPRLTRVGGLLRRLSLDELPQLLNVLGGSMSLVGPRPHAPNTKAGDTLFHDAVEAYASRHRVKPGITGWAQVNGWRGETRTLEHIQQRVAHDLAYIDNWSLRFDLRIILLTIQREIRSRNAY